jgi:NADPH-dependent 2,4-dienoyl-CoA reductase/sulfur reductase-like enzyme
MTYDRLLVATGARARRLAVPGADLPGIHVLRTIDDCAAITADLSVGAPVVVVGGGFIGCEVAATLATIGHDVSIIEPLPTLLFRALGTDIGELMARRHREHGVRVETGTAVSGFVGAGRVEAVELADGRRFPAAVVVVGVGAVPDCAWLEGSGLQLDDGILCDEFCESSTPGVYAAGDVARFRHPWREHPVRIEHWTNAGEQGAAAAANMLLERDARVAHVPVPYVWSDQFGVKLQIFGFTDGVDEQVVIADPVDPAKWLALFGRAGALAAVAALGRPALALRFRNSLLLGHTLAQTVSAASTLR